MGWAYKPERHCFLINRRCLLGLLENDSLITVVLKRETRKDSESFERERGAVLGLSLGVSDSYSLTSLTAIGVQKKHLFSLYHQSSL